ncbi:MAG: glycosyltransferase family 39 protein, partial [Anaerolineales bacterium]
MKNKLLKMTLSKNYQNGLALFGLAIGIFMRGVSFMRNTRLYGDVNLFALTARQVAQKGQLSYGIKYDFSPLTPYLNLNSPASQHPPLFAILAGILTRIFNSYDTFFFLKVWSLIFGLILLLLIYINTQRNPTLGNWCAFVLWACSPWLIDYSANGSPYIFLGLLLWIGQWLWSKSDQPSFWIVIGAGILCGLGWLTHGILLLMPVAFIVRFLFFSKEQNVRGPRWVGLFLGIFVLVISPWLVWNYRTFGSLFYSLSSYYLLEQLKIASVQITEQSVVWVIEKPNFIPLIS